MVAGGPNRLPIPIVRCVCCEFRTWQFEDSQTHSQSVSQSFNHSIIQSVHGELDCYDILIYTIIKKLLGD